MGMLEGAAELEGEDETCFLSKGRDQEGFSEKATSELDLEG